MKKRSRKCSIYNSSVKWVAVCDIDSVHKTNKQAIYNNKNMKVRLMTKVSAATLISAIACIIFTGCTEKDLYNPERGKTELKPESEYFDFATTAS